MHIQQGTQMYMQTDKMKLYDQLATACTRLAKSIDIVYFTSVADTPSCKQASIKAAGNLDACINIPSPI